MGPNSFGAENPDTSSTLTTVLDILNATTHIAIGAVAFAAFLFANFVSEQALGQHIILCVIGYVIMMGLGILSVSPHTGWSRTLNYEQRRGFHLGLNALGCVFVIAGTSVMISDRGMNYSVHGTTGLIAMIFTIMSFCGGVLQFFKVLPRITRILHFISGASTVILGFLTLIFGFHYYHRNVFGNNTANSLIAVTTYTFVGILISAVIKNVQRLR